MISQYNCSDGARECFWWSSIWLILGNVPKTLVNYSQSCLVVFHIVFQSSDEIPASSGGSSTYSRWGSQNIPRTMIMYDNSWLESGIISKRLKRNEVSITKTKNRRDAISTSYRLFLKLGKSGTHWSYSTRGISGNVHILPNSSGKIIMSTWEMGWADCSNFMQLCKHSISKRIFGTQRDNLYHQTDHQSKYQKCRVKILGDS